MYKLILKRIRHGLSWRFLHAKQTILSHVRSTFAVIQVNIRFFIRAGNSLPHHLSGELIISLTSYKPRFTTLLPTLKCLLTQSIRADRVILWIADDEINHVPPKVLALQSKRLEIRGCKDIGPYKKIIPAIQAFPEAFIVTADDDVYYHENWLRDLILPWDGSGRKIVCHRAHGIKFGGNELPTSYRSWDFDIEGPIESVNIFPTGVGGIFYPPGCLSHEVTEEEKFMTLAHKADDIWLYWMGRRAGAIYQKTSGRMPHILWRNSQKVALADDNLRENANDKKINAMIEHYGWPV